MLVFVGIGLSAASLLFNIIGLAIPYWWYDSEDGISSYSGLWKVCGSGGGQSVCLDIPESILGNIRNVLLSYSFALICKIPKYLLFIRI